MRCILYQNWLGLVQKQFDDGSIMAWFHDNVGGPGYLLRLWKGEWRYV
jgi:hypothetical protein